MSTEKNGVLIPDAAARKGMRAKAKANQLPPQRCPMPGCHKNLSDPTVPARYRHYAKTFGTAIERRDEKNGTGVWECPHCGARFAKHRLA